MSESVAYCQVLNSVHCADELLYTQGSFFTQHHSNPLYLLKTILGSGLANLNDHVP